MDKTEIARRIAKINAGLTTVQNIYGKNSSIFKRMMSTVEKVSGHTRFKTSDFIGENLTLRDLNRSFNALETIEQSAYITKVGRKRIGEQARQTFFERHVEDYDEKDIVKMYDVFKNSGYFSRFGELFTGQSELLIDEILNAFETDTKLTSKKAASIVDEVLKQNGLESAESTISAVRSKLRELKK